MRVILTAGSDQKEWIPHLRTHREGLPYAILSHRWSEEPQHEILFADVNDVDGVKNAQFTNVDVYQKPAFAKVKSAARRALLDGYQYIWIDTCCIDKSSSAELSEAINSMFKWYASSAKCYVYLQDCDSHDVTHIENWVGGSSFARSAWWTRSWTLQELLAPVKVVFYAASWMKIGNKDDPRLIQAISIISRIDVNVINGAIPIHTVNIAQRMNWAALRKATRSEDIAYSLMGIFSVNMPLLYGEGEAAFLRLQQEIIRVSDDDTIFAWKDSQHTTKRHTKYTSKQHVQNGLLTKSPLAFKSARPVTRQYSKEIQAPFAMSNRGLSISLPLTSYRDLHIAWLSCVDCESGRRVGIYLKKLASTSNQYARVYADQLVLETIVIEETIVALYVQQHHDQIPARIDIDYSAKYIRLVQVLSVKDDSDLKLRLFTADMMTARYIALSYPGRYFPDRDSKTYNTATLNGNKIKLERTAYNFLRQAHAFDRQTLYWIRDVCVLFDNWTVMLDSWREEKYHVRMVKEIFDRASEIIILLENCDVCHLRCPLKGTEPWSRPAFVTDHEEIPLGSSLFQRRNQQPWIFHEALKGGKNHVLLSESSEILSLDAFQKKHSDATSVGRVFAQCYGSSMCGAQSPDCTLHWKPFSWCGKSSDGEMWDDYEGIRDPISKIRIMAYDRLNNEP